MTLALIADLPGFILDSPRVHDSRITLVAQSTQTTATCPTCHTVTTHTHSRYCRHLADLPWCAKATQLTLRVHRFRCHNAACPRVTFVEPLPTIAPPYAQRTCRRTIQQQQLALALGGEAGARMAHRLALGTSPDTMLRLIRAFQLPVPAAPIHIGIDDWAKRKGQSYGTIIVDLDTHQVIDLLPDRTVEGVATWLQAHPTIEVISRDRADVYRTGATQGAPQAAQCADRWHLIHNLGAAVQRLLERHGPALRATAQQIAASAPSSQPEPPAPPPCEIAAEPPLPQASAQRQHQFAEVKRLHAAGWSIRQIGLHLNLNRRTVRRYVHAETVPVRILPQNRSHAEPYLPILAALWADGCQTYQQLWQEAQAVGFSGSYSSIRRLMKQFDPHDRRGAAPAAPPAGLPAARPLSARQAMWLLVRQPDALTPADAQTRAVLCDHCPEAKVAATLAQRFATLLRDREVAGLDDWLLAAEGSGVPEIRRFALGLRQDDAAIRMAVAGPYSNGPVEAHVHRLKLIKRTMYGRANFDLLRKRVLAQI